MSQDTNVENLIINKLTKAQFESIANPDPTQMYLLTDDNGLSSLEDVSLNNVADGQVLTYNGTTRMWENSTSSNEFVRKSGDTMTGILNINRTTGSNFIGMQSGQITRGTTPSSTVTLGFMELRDKNSAWVGKNQMQFASSGEYKMELSTRNASSDSTSKLSVGWDANNIAFATAPATSTTRTNANDIVTRGYLSDFLKNEATVTSSLIVGSNDYNGDTSVPNSVIIQGFAPEYCENVICIGAGSTVGEPSGSIAIGYNAHAGTGDYAVGSIQLGTGVAELNSFCVGMTSNYKLLDLSSGIIPDARLSTNIARTSAIPTATSDLTNDSGFITGITSSNVTTALGYTPADNTLSNVSSIDANSAVKTALDTKVNTSDIWYDSTSKTLYIGVAQS